MPGGSDASEEPGDMRETLMAQWIALVVMAGLLGASAFFSASETALFSLQREVLGQFREGRGRRARLAVSLLETPRELLATILFGNLIVNTLFYAVTALTAYRLATADKHAEAAIVGALGLVLVITFGEIIPKATALTFNTTVAPLVSVPLWGIYTVLRPVRYLVGAVVRVLTVLALRVVHAPTRITREELTMLVEATGAQGHIPPQEGEMIEGVMGLGETRVREVMTPRVDIVGVDASATLEELIEIFRRTRRTKVVAYHGDIDHVTGIAYVRDALLGPATKLVEVTKEVTFVPEAKTAEALLLEFQKTRSTISVVVDEYGGTAGVVTLADLAREIVGPIGDEYEAPERLVEEAGPGDYRLAGDLSLKEWNELFDTYVVDERLSTLGGFIVMLLGRVPHAGDTAAYKNIRFTVGEVRRHRIVWVRARLSEETAAQGQGERS